MAGPIDWIVNKKPVIRQKQVALQAEAGKNLVYLRGSRSKIYFSAYMVLWSAAFLGSGFQLIQYARGKAKKVGE